MMAWHNSTISSLTIARDRERRGDVLVVVFLRGGADGLNLVVPYADDSYYRARPSLGIRGPNDSKAASAERAIDLDGYFGLNPELEPLHSLFADGKLLLVHGCGSEDQTRSHFEAMATVERGQGRDGGPASGWLARHLMTSSLDEPALLRAVAFGPGLPDSLRGADHAVALRQLDDFRLHVPKNWDAVGLNSTLADLYQNSADEVATAGREALRLLERVAQLDVKHYRPGNSAEYPDTELGRDMRQVACLIRGKLGLEVACLDFGGWDTHFVQGTIHPRLLRELSSGLAAFAQDLGPELNRVTVLVMTEFGRRVYENSSAGTDHGRASCWMLLGDGIAGGRVLADWKGLDSDRLEPPGDVPVTIDYRDILGEVIEKRLGNSHVHEVFPGFSFTSQGVTNGV
jgi:uncharacterized protein (DUF1501 family)